MLKIFLSALAALALSACATKPVVENSDSSSVPANSELATPEVTTGGELAGNPAQSIQVAVMPDDMGYLYAVVFNPTNVTFANVHVLVVHFSSETHQPDRQSIPLLVAATLGPNQGAKLKLEGVQVYSKADLQLYRAILERAELVK